MSNCQETLKTAAAHTEGSVLGKRRRLSGPGAGRERWAPWLGDRGESVGDGTVLDVAPESLC